MLGNSWIELFVYFILLIGLTPLLGHFIARVMNGEKLHVISFFQPVERAIFRASGVNPNHEMGWKEYAFSLLSFNVVGIVVLFLLQIFQKHLPLNPRGFSGVHPLLALNTAVSFVMNTNWQAYSGEVTLSYFSQLIGLTVQNFVSAAEAIVVLAALARGISRREASTLGNFWVDLIRATLYILLPVSFILSILLVSQGAIQNIGNYVDAKTIQGAVQTLPMGPAASQIAIKQLGTNGGGFFGSNSAHPFENPTPLSNFLEMLAILILPAACAYAWGILVKNRRHGIALLTAMFAVTFLCLAVAIWAELHRNPVLGGLPFMEGKEIRFGIIPSVLWEMATTLASNGSVNSMHSSSSPIAGGMAMFNMMMGEVIFGGIGSGLYGIVFFAILTVYIAGLMVGRTPEYLAKKIEAPEVVYALLGVLLPSAAILFLASISCVLPQGLASLGNKGPHGLSEILYAFTSASQNNGSAFASLNADTAYYNITTAIAMLIGRYGFMIPSLAIAGSLVRKKYVPPSAGTFPTEGYLFITLLIGVIIIVGALTFFPALCLGPIMEHFLMNAGRVF